MVCTLKKPSYLIMNADMLHSSNKEGMQHIRIKLHEMPV